MNNQGPLSDEFTPPEAVRRSLSLKLLLLTILFVLVAEIVVLIPSISKQRVDWINARIETAYLVGLALEGDDAEMITEATARQLFTTAEILGVTVNRDDMRILVLAPDFADAAASIKYVVDFEQQAWPQMIASAWGTLFSTDEGLIRVMGAPRFAGGGSVDIIVSKSALRRDLAIYARNVLGLSLIISTLTASFVFWALDRLIVRPVKRLRTNMAAFEAAPEDPKTIIIPSTRQDEIGAAEHGLAALERRTQNLLNESRRLAALGAGISKISHDLRNILASAQMMSDRLAISEDPRVKKLAPRLVQALDRAIALSRDTLRFGKMTPEALSKEDVNLYALVDEVFDDTAAMNVEMENNTSEDMHITADKTQIYRCLFNLVRNATDAMSALPDEEARTRRVIISSRMDTGATIIDVTDTGPGVPQAASDHLFEPFKGSQKPGGSGLGLAIASEIARAHGGQLQLAKTGAEGATFEITLPVIPIHQYPAAPEPGAR